MKIQQLILLLLLSVPVSGAMGAALRECHYRLSEQTQNTRAIINDKGEVVQRNNYYAYGGIIPELSFDAGYNYTFGGKEKINTFGVGYSDFHARMFNTSLIDPPISWQIDPMTETFYNKTPYGLFGQNPISRIDPDGMSDYSINTDGYFQMVRQTDDKFDMLYTHAAYSEGNFDGGLKISDQELLPQMLKSTGVKGYYGNSVTLSLTENGEDAFSVFKFASDNTQVEWQLDGYHVNNLNYSTGIVKLIVIQILYKKTIIDCLLWAINSISGGCYPKCLMF